MTTNDYNMELSIIKTIAKNNDYSTELIDHILKRKHNKLMIKKYIYAPDASRNNDKPWRKILYIGNISETLSRTNKNNFKTAFYTRDNLNKLLFNNKDKKDAMNDGGVYLIWCGDCDAKYVGETGRPISTRLKEHQRAFRGLSGYSEMADHCIVQDHKFDPNNVKVLHSERHRNRNPGDPKEYRGSS
jgi:hypothetical protein